MNLPQQFARATAFAFLVLSIWSQATLADDLWSPGSGGPMWARITRLQSVNLKSRVRSPFVSECCLSDDPVERLAAIAWIGRTRSEKHVPDLELRLADQIREVRLWLLKRCKF